VAKSSGGLIPPPGVAGIRSVWPGSGGCSPMGPFGYGDEEGEPIKKFTVGEVKDALVQKIKDEPGLIQDNIQLMTSDRVDRFRKEFWPAAIDPDQWIRTATHRPDKDAEGNRITGTDLEVREFENDFWMDNGGSLSAEVHTEFGEIKQILVKCSW
jgi:hypothetical protein